MAEGHQRGRKPTPVSSSKICYIVTIMYVSPNVLLLLMM